jgi:hypothetical protein
MDAIPSIVDQLWLLPVLYQLVSMKKRLQGRERQGKEAMSISTKDKRLKDKGFGDKATNKYIICPDTNLSSTEFRAIRRLV